MAAIAHGSRLAPPPGMSIVPHDGRWREIRHPWARGKRHTDDLRSLIAAMTDPETGPADTVARSLIRAALERGDTVRHFERARDHPLLPGVRYTACVEVARIDLSELWDCTLVCLPLDVVGISFELPTEPGSGTPEEERQADDLARRILREGAAASERTYRAYRPGIR